ncbi:hypothetical protein D3C80_1318720 [compost metagenome]
MVHSLKVEVFEPRVAQNLYEFDLSEQRDFDWVVDVQAWLGDVAETRDHAGGLTAAARWVDMPDEIQHLATKVTLQLAVVIGSKRGKKVGLARLRKAEKAHGHRVAGTALEVFRLVARAP